MSKSTGPLTIWTNALFADAENRLFAEGTRRHKVVYAPDSTKFFLGAAKPDPALLTADIAFGQPDVAQCLENSRLRMIEVTTAGYTRYDTPEFLEAMRARGTAFCNVSEVFADSCAQHVLAMMLALGRQLLASHKDQLTVRGWEYAERRYNSRNLTGQTVVLLGFGAIGRRLAELLAPFGMTIMAVRRQTRSERGVRVIPEERVSSALAEADHVVNILPRQRRHPKLRERPPHRLLQARRAFLYNVGRGSTVDERARCSKVLRSGRIADAVSRRVHDGAVARRQRILDAPALPHHAATRPAAATIRTRRS